MSEWQPISTAPKDGPSILLCDDNTVTLGWWQDAEDDGVDYMGADAGFVDYAFNDFNPSRLFGNKAYQYKGNQPTHWMPLPEPPK